MRRASLRVLALAIAALIVLRIAGVVELPARWLALAIALDIVLGLAELALVVAALRAFVDGTRSGGFVAGYEAAIERERELGIPRPVIALMRLEARLYRAVAQRIAIKTGTSTRSGSARRAP